MAMCSGVSPKREPSHLVLPRSNTPTDDRKDIRIVRLSIGIRRVRMLALSIVMVVRCTWIDECWMRQALKLVRIDRDRPTEGIEQINVRNANGLHSDGCCTFKGLIGAERLTIMENVCDVCVCFYRRFPSFTHGWKDVVRERDEWRN